MSNWETVADGEDIDINKYLDFRQYDTVAERDAASAAFGTVELFRICRVVATGAYYYWSGAAWAEFPSLGGAGAPPSCSFVTINAEGSLSAETQHANITGASLHVTKAHKAEHEDAGADEISVAGLSGVLADEQDAGLIKGKVVDDAAIADGKALVYKSGTGNIEYETVSTAVHNLGGAQHNPDTLANLNTKVSDATLDDSGDPRDPNAHAASHENAGADEISVAGLSGALADEQDAGSIKGVTVDDAAIADGMVLGYQAASGKIEYIAAPAAGAHAASHENGGGDEISVAGLSGELADSQPPKTHKATHVEGGGDTFADTDLLSAIARTTVRRNSGANVGSRRRLNFIDTASATWNITDDPANEETDVQVTCTNAGAYKLAPSYTIYLVGGVYYAMDEDGNIDYSGASFHTVFNDCVSALTSGGQIHLKGHTTFTATGTCTINQSNIFVTGESWSSKVQAGASLNANIFSVTGANCRMQNFLVDGNKANNTSGYAVYLNYGSSGGWWGHNLCIQNAEDCALYINSALGGKFSHSKIDTPKNEGIHISTGSTDWEFVDLLIKNYPHNAANASNVGIYWDGSSNILNSAHIYGWYTDILLCPLTSCSRVIWKAVKVYEATHDGILQSHSVWDGMFDIQFWGNSYHRDGQNDDWFCDAGGGGLDSCVVSLQSYGRKDTADESNYCLHFVESPNNCSFVGCNSRSHKIAEYDVNGGAGNVQAACVPAMTF